MTACLLVEEMKDLIASRKPLPGSEAVRCVKPRSVHAEIGAVCRAPYTAARDTRGRRSDSQCKIPTESSYLEPVYSAG